MPSNINNCCYASSNNCTESNPQVIKSGVQGPGHGNYLRKINPKLHKDSSKVAHYSCYDRVYEESIRSNYSKLYFPAAAIAGTANGGGSSQLRHSDSPYGQSYNVGEGFTGKGDPKNPANQLGRNIRKAADVACYAYGIPAKDLEFAIKSAQKFSNAGKQLVLENTVVPVKLGNGKTEMRFVVAPQARLKDQASGKEYAVIDNGDGTKETQWIHKSSSGYKYIIV